MQDLFTLLLKTSWQTAVLILLVLAAQRAFGPRLSARWRCALWLLVMVRLAMPLTLPSQASVFNLLKVARVPDSLRANPSRPALKTEAARVVGGGATDPDGTAERPHRPWAAGLRSRAAWFIGVWAVGAGALAGYVLVTHTRLSRRIRLERPLVDAEVLTLLEDCKQRMGVRVPVTLLESGHVGSPSLFGFMRPRLLLPLGLTRSFSPEELRYVFLHELAHIKRKDIFVGWMATGLQVLHWFNPFVWLAFHRMRADREVACDALALSHAQENENQRYGDTIIKLLETFGRSAWAPSLAGAVENKNQLRERFRMIATFRKNKGGMALAAIVFAALGTVTFTDAQSTASKTDNDLIGTWILVGRPGEVGEAPAAGGRTKTITESEWSVTQAHPETGATLFHLGGTYTRNGREYIERVEYANENTKKRVGNSNRFNIKIEGDALTLVGVGNPFSEVWKRVKPEAATPQKADVAALQGTWTGAEPTGRTKATASLIIDGSNLEFHGADTNEWYKATFSAYDTSPQQLVVVITECPFPDYVHKGSYAIFELQDGTLTITGNEPGFPGAPTNFDAVGARKMVFKRE
jgi:beta-lactamase regulating signal transducer with metallopeptidase domain